MDTVASSQVIIDKPNAMGNPIRRTSTHVLTYVIIMIILRRGKGYHYCVIPSLHN